MARGDQLSRQWRLIRFLDHPNGFTVDEAINCFRAKLPAPFTLSEVVALLMSRDLLAPTSGSVLAPSVHAAFAKIRALLPDKACMIAG